MQPDLIKLEKLIKSKKAILVNNKLIKRILGFSDMRDFIDSLHSWAYTTDFYSDRSTEDWQSILRRYIKDNFLE